jgi:hypothetical protein
MMVQVLIKSNQNKWVILGHELTENDVRKQENSVSPLAAPHRGLVLQVPHWFGTFVSSHLYMSQSASDKKIINLS